MKSGEKRDWRVYFGMTCACFFFSRACGGIDVPSGTQGMDTSWEVMDDGLPCTLKSQKREGVGGRRSRSRSVERFSLYKTSMTTTRDLGKITKHRQVWDHAPTQSARLALVADSVSGSDATRCRTRARGRDRLGRPKLDEANAALQRHARGPSQHAVHVRLVAPVSYGPSVTLGMLSSYGGIFELGPREYTLDDFYALQLDKLERFVCLKPSGIIIPTEAEESSDDEGGSGDEGSDDDEEDDDDDDEGVTGSEGEREKTRKGKAKEESKGKGGQRQEVEESEEEPERRVEADEDAKAETEAGGTEAGKVYQTPVTLSKQF